MWSILIIKSFSCQTTVCHHREQVPLYTSSSVRRRPHVKKTCDNRIFQVPNNSLPSSRPSTSIYLFLFYLYLLGIVEIVTYIHHSFIRHWVVEVLTITVTWYDCCCIQATLCRENDTCLWHVHVIGHHGHIRFGQPVHSTVNSCALMRRLCPDQSCILCHATAISPLLPFMLR